MRALKAKQVSLVAAEPQPVVADIVEEDKSEEDGETRVTEDHKIKESENPKQQEIRGIPIDLYASK